MLESIEISQGPSADQPFNVRVQEANGESTSYFTNVEGLMPAIENILNQAHAQVEKALDAVEARLDAVEAKSDGIGDIVYMKGQSDPLIIVGCRTDDYGNSGIVHSVLLLDHNGRSRSLPAAGLTSEREFD